MPPTSSGSTSQRLHSETGEQYTELALDESRTRMAALFQDGSVIIIQRCDGAACIDLNPEQAMHLANSILAQSQKEAL